MGSYKASKNNVTEDIEQTQDEKNEQATQDVLKAGLDVAEHIPVAAVYAKAAKFADKLTGGAVTKGASKIVNQGLKNSPMGAQAQNAINAASDSGLTNVASQAANMKSGNISGGLNSGGTNANSMLGGLGKIDGSSTDGNIMGKLTSQIPPSLKIKIYVGVGIFFFLIMIFVTVFAEDDEINLGATNNTSINSSSSTGSVPCSTEEIENNLIYIGDSRIVGMKYFVENKNVKYIAKSAEGYNWLVSYALGELDTKLNENPKSIIVLALGINDLFNIDKYINEYHNLLSKYPDTAFYVMSVNPVDESKTSIKNSRIEEFNNKLKENFPNDYLDSYSKMGNIGSNDGVHYDSTTYKNVHNIVVESIGNSGKAMCDSSGANYLGDITTCSLTVIGDKYYKTVNPQTSDCYVSGFYDNNSWGLEPSFYANVLALIEDASSQGCKASIISGHRTYAKQAYLYNCYLTKKCNNGNMAAKPGRSNHEYGIAADLRYYPDNSKCLNYYHTNAAKYGLDFPLLYASFPEDWHIEPINIIKGTP